MDKDRNRKSLHLRLVNSVDNNSDNDDSRKSDRLQGKNEQDSENRPDRGKRDRKSSTTHDGEGSEMF